MSIVRSTSAVRFPSRGGFTFIELMIVVVVLGVTIALSVPRVAVQVSARRVQTAGSLIAADVEEAFALAGGARRPVRLTWTESSGALVIADRASGEVYRERMLTPESSFGVARATVVPSTVDFFPGGISSSAITIELSSGSHVRRVRATRAGLVQVDEPREQLPEAEPDLEPEPET
jgi:prepilin-type N-terminal cleavage/methylation domain-containing protein